jgi:hypothetical protein
MLWIFISLRMLKSLKRKTLVEIELPIWAKVRYFAIINGISSNEALETLLVEALNNNNAGNQLQTLNVSRKSEIIPVAASFQANSNQVSEEIQ